ncbi:unnamed protein product [Macrosiphum euphorbiae]|uniref:Transposable element P transposase-like RNase H C-terminal domain-containing protein n=2 Tax=Macrosiphum euphorbiae TaxID=13131 RepID=A0AAV0YCK5_9HEMI|nr:unnamed protein product [Macrosiphum euphorbiae]
MNCRTKFSKNPYNLCLDINTVNKYREFTEIFEKYIFNLKFQNGQRIIDSNRKTGFIGLVYGLKNLLNLYEYLNSKYGLNYLLSYKLSQDHIETFFSAVRMRGGHNNNPTCKQFFTAYKKLLVHNQATASQYGNCLAMLDPTELSVVNVGPDSITSQINETDEAIVVEHDHSYFQSLKRLSPLVENISEYIGGFVVKKTLKKINCAICQQSLYKTFTNNILINLKDRNDALIKPFRDVVDICLIAERVFRSCDNIFKNNIKNSLFTKIKRHIIYSSTKKNFQELDDHCLSQNLFNNHRDQLIALIIYIYLDVRLHHAAKESNHNKIKLRQKLTKLILFRNE